MKTIKQVYKIKAPVARVWNSLVKQKEIEAWGGGPAIMKGKEGEEFFLWGGDIHGKNLLVKKEKELKQEWFSGEWKEASIVTFTVEEHEGITTVALLHENIPDNEAKDIADGWNEYYLGPLKKYVEES